MYRGYVKLWRKSFDSAVWTDPDLWRTWSCCLLLANHEPAWVKIDGLAWPVKIERGQFITGRFEFHNRMFPKKRKSNPDPRTTWRWLQSLESCGNLTIKSTNKFSIITLVNWGHYQSGDSQNVQQNVPLMSSTCPAGVQHVSTNKNEKNEKKKNLSASPDAGQTGEPDFYLTKKRRKLTGKRLEAFNTFWTAFGYAKGKAEAADAWMSIPQLNTAIMAQIIHAATLEAQRRPALLSEGRTPKMAQGWITGRRWEDEDMKAKPVPSMRDRWERIPLEIRKDYAEEYADVLNKEERDEYLGTAVQG